MKKYSFSIILLAVISMMVASCVKDRVKSVTIPNTGSDTLIAYYDFNVDPTIVSILTTPTLALNVGTMMTYAGTGGADTTQFGTNINGLGTDTVLSPTCAGLLLHNPAGPFIMYFPTTGYKDIVLKFAEERSGKGAIANTMSYSVDGVHFINTAIASSAAYPVNVGYEMHTFDFTSDTLCNNNPLFQVKIEFTYAAGADTTKGHDHFDNITLYGKKK